MRIHRIIAALLSCTFIPLSAQNVCSLGEKSYASIQDAVNEVKKGGTIKVLSDVKLDSTIKVASSTPAFTLDLNGHVLDGSNIPMPDGKNTYTGDIIQNRGDLTIIDSNPDAVHTDSLSAIKGGVMTGGKGEYYQVENGKYASMIAGGAIFNSGKLSINGIAFFRNYAGGGGAVLSRKGTITVTDCNFLENSCDINGSQIGMVNGHSILTNCKFEDGYGYYGAIYSQGDTLTMDNCVINGNKADGTGGGLYVRSNSLVTLNGCTFSKNTADYNGGAFFVEESQVKVTGCTFTDNTSNYGGACYLDEDSESTFTSCIFTGNSSKDSGGGLNGFHASCSLVNCEMTGNSCGRQGGAIAYTGTVYTEDCKVTGNTSAGSYPSAGVYMYNAELHIKGKMIIKDNTTNGKPANLCLSGYESCDQFTIEGLVDGSEIGVSTEWDDSEGTYRFTTNGTAGDLKYFSADNSLYAINYNADGYLETVPTADCPMVCSIGDTKYPTVQNAVAAVRNGETIKILDDLKLTSSINVSASIPAFTLDLNGHVLDGSTILENNIYREILRNNGDLTIIDSNPNSVHTDSLSAIKGAVMTGGNGLYQYEDNLPTIDGVEWRTGYYGGAIFNTGKLSVTGITFFRNSIDYAGGAIASITNEITIDNCHFLENSATGENAEGGALYLVGGKSTISNSTFEGNYSELYAAGISSNYDDDGMTVTNCQFKGNDGWYGGAISIYNTSNNTFIGCTFEENNSFAGSGLLIDSSNATLKECRISKNSAYEGPGINAFYYSKFTLEDCTITENASTHPDFASGGIFMFDSECTLKGKMIVKGNTRDGKQANLWHDGENTFSRTVIDGLKDGSEIGVSTGLNYTEGVYRFTTNGTADDLKYFTSDNSLYTINYNDEGYLETLPTADCPIACCIGDRKYPTIRNAVNVVKANETVKVLADAKLTSTIYINKYRPAFTLDLNGHVLDGSEIPAPDGDDSNLGNVIYNNTDLTIVDSNPDAVHTESLSAIKGGVITGGKGAYYEMKDGSASPKLGGGAIYSCGKLTISDITFFENTAYWGGAILSNRETLTLSNCNFVENDAQSLGSSINAIFGNSNITGCTFTDGSSYYGTVYIQADTLAMSKCVFSGNETECGGGIFSADEQNSVTVNECVFSNNTSNHGGALYIESSKMEVAGCTFNDNAAVEGGACSSGWGSELSFTNCTFTNNSAESYGAGVNSYNSKLTLVKCEFIGNDCDGQGGAVSSTSDSICTLIMEDCKVTENYSGSGHPSAGVYLWDSECYLKGEIIIKDNTTKGKSANLCLSGEFSCSQSTIDGLKAGSQIGVTTELNDEVGAYRFTTNGTADDLKYFTSDNKLYAISYNADGYLETLTDATAISEVSDTESESSDVYDLSGRKILSSKAVKGIYISNGKKVIR